MTPRASTSTSAAQAPTPTTSCSAEWSQPATPSTRCGSNCSRDIPARGCNCSAGVGLAAEQLHPRAGISLEQLLPHRVDGVAGCDHSALHDVVGVGACAALVEVEARGVITLIGALALLLRNHVAGIDPEKQRDDDDQEAAESAADRDSAAG